MFVNTYSSFTSEDRLQTYEAVLLQKTMQSPHTYGPGSAHNMADYNLLSKTLIIFGWPIEVSYR